MKYTQIQRKSQDFITIGEYIKETQLSVYRRLYKEFKLYIKSITELVTAAADVSGIDKQYARLMEERPKGGRGGLLPGEKEEELHGKLQNL